MALNLRFGLLFKVLSDPVRTEILEMLKDKRMSAGEISEKFDLSNATISYHLSQLKKADLVSETKEKNFIYYELNSTIFEEVIIWIKNISDKKY